MELNDKYKQNVVLLIAAGCFGGAFAAILSDILQPRSMINDILLATICIILFFGFMYFSKKELKNSGAYK